MNVVRRGATTISGQIVLLAITLISLGPLAFMAATSLRTTSDYALNPAGLPGALTWDNYIAALTDLPTLRWALNSFLVSATSVAVSTAIATLAAFAITFGRFRGRSVLLGGSIGFIMVPPVVLLLPMFVFMVNVKLVNNLASVTIFYSCLLVPFAIFFLVTFFRTIPAELLEAAVVDGAGPLRSLVSVVLPLSRAALLTVATVNLIWAWNELLISLVFLQDENQRTLMAGLSLLQGRYTTNQPLLLAAAMLSVIPVALFYLFSQRSFVKGLTAGIGK
jgi:ABC-type glycerol-3-phosphate transport system permease component